jgi:hypothetical protein
MFKTLLVAALAAVAVASPLPGGHSENNDNQVCKNGSVHCCNDKTAKQITGAGLVGVAADISQLLGKCNEVNVLAIPIENKCNAQTICCGQNKQNVSNMVSHHSRRRQYTNSRRVSSTSAALPSLCKQPDSISLANFTE